MCYRLRKTALEENYFFQKRVYRKGLIFLIGYFLGFVLLPSNYLAVGDCNAAGNSLLQLKRSILVFLAIQSDCYPNHESVLRSFLIKLEVLKEYPIYSVLDGTRIRR